MTMQALETTYAGHRFRSRLEARWAVLFTALGIPWEYEPQGYLVDGGPYLPDFRLWGHLHAEVKPPHAPDRGQEFYEDLLERTRGMDKLLVLVGRPRVVWYPVLCAEPHGLTWLDLDQASLDQRPRYRFATHQPPVEDLTWPRLRFERAVDAANMARFDRRAA